MAVTGACLVGFLIGHLVGNLQIFLPPEALNRYAHFLQSTPEILWPARAGLLVLITLHIASAIHLALENRAARPVAYARDPALQTSTFASRTMLVSGGIVACFVVFHLLHFTVRVEALNGASVPFHALKDPRTGHPDVYAMVVAGFSVWYIALCYVVGIGLLCVHLSHGVGAMFQSLGLMNRAYRGWIDGLAKGLAVLLFVGYVSIPAAVLLGGHGRDYLNEVAAASVTPLAQEVRQ
jgi:succinate dehydrogenase / fumarate reductase cytochrome b subunit